MKLPKEYKKYIGNFDHFSSASGRKMLRKFGYGPDIVEEVKPKKKKTSKKKSD